MLVSRGRPSVTGVYLVVLLPWLPVGRRQRRIRRLAELLEALRNGSAAGQCKIPRGVATDPVSGHLYIADQSNQRIVEFTAWGEFVKAFGWGVEDGSAELQSCTVASTCRAGLCREGVGRSDVPKALPPTRPATSTSSI